MNVLKSTRNHRNSLGFVLPVIILCIAIALRLYVRFLDPMITRDGCLYIQTAKSIIESNKDIHSIGEITQGIPPLYLIIIYLLSFWVPSEIAGIGFNIFVGSLCACIIYEISNEIMPHKKEISFAAAILACINPSMITLSIEPQRDALYLFLNGIFILCVLKILRKNSVFKWCIAGAVFSLSLLTRYESIELLPIIIFILVFCVLKKRLSIKQAITSGLLFIVCSLFMFHMVLEVIGEKDYIVGSYNIYLQKQSIVLKNGLEEM